MSKDELNPDYISGIAFGLAGVSISEYREQNSLERGGGQRQHWLEMCHRGSSRLFSLTFLHLNQQRTFLWHVTHMPTNRT